MNVPVRGQPYAVQVAAPLHELLEGLNRIFWILVAAIPLVLALASLGGYWMSRRALVPVDEITNAARSISAQNLSRRLPVSQTGDELHKLSLTLNAMFERLDTAFGRISQFTPAASHELRTPIAFMRTTAEVALRKQRSETDYRTALAQILSELERTSALIDNAVKYTGAGGRVRVGVIQHDGTAVIDVEDSGIGIAGDDLPRIFDRFYRADRARSRETGGAGLGLALASWIVRAHRGEIRVESKVGQGSHFTVVLPVSTQIERGSAGRGDSSPAAAPGRHHRSR